MTAQRFGVLPTRLPKIWRVLGARIRAKPHYPVVEITDSPLNAPWWANYDASLEHANSGTASTRPPKGTSGAERMVSGPCLVPCSLPRQALHTAESCAQPHGRQATAASPFLATSASSFSEAPRGAPPERA